MGKLGVGRGHSVHTDERDVQIFFLSISVMAQMIKNPPAI